jgi:predicted small secreted protein
MKRFYQKTLIIAAVVLLIFSLSSCRKVPGEDMDVSRLIDFRLNNFKATKFEFDEIGDFLENESFKGNMVQIHYNRSFKNEVVNSTDFIVMVAAKAENNRSAYKLWRVFAGENDASFKAAFSTLPFFKGEYSHETDDAYIISWYDGKWFFFIKTSTEVLRDTMKMNLETFFENDTVVNESVIDI